MATRAPAAHSLASVSVVHADCTRADALATALIVLGLWFLLQLLNGVTDLLGVHLGQADALRQLLRLAPADGVDVGLARL